MPPRFPELGFYALPGQVTDPRPMLTEVRDGDACGFGSVWLSERFDVKEAAALAGAATALSDGLGVSVGVTNPHTRHPVLLAALGGTLSSLSRDRFSLGLGRGIDAVWDRYGMPRVRLEMLEDVAALLRRLWAGETIAGHDGPAGRFGTLSLPQMPASTPPLMLAALGPHAQALGGRAFDGVLLHSHWLDESVAAAVTRVRASAEAAGRDPSTIRIWACLVTACDLPEEEVLRRVVARLAGALRVPGYGEAIVDGNGIERELLSRVRAHPMATIDELRALRALCGTWIERGNAIGTPEHCAQRILDQFSAGADGVILHGSTPAELTPVLRAYAERRPPGRFAERAVNPAR
jgi:5,10-methylenetetrahydromethanopterin reductase